MINGTNIFLGVGPAIYTDPILAGDALEAAPVDALGAELIPMADAYEPLQEELQHYKASLLEENLEEAAAAQKAMAKNIRARTAEEWQVLLQRVEKCPWAFNPGFFKTPELASQHNLRKEIVVPNLDVLGTLLAEQLLKAVEPGNHRPPTFVYNGSWPAEPPFSLPSALLKKADAEQIRTPLLHVYLPLEKRLYSLYPHQYRTGEWGIYYFSAPSERVRSEWDSAYIMQEGFEIGELSPTHHEKYVPPFNEAFHARMQKYPALKKWIDLETMWGTIETEATDRAKGTSNMAQNYIRSMRGMFTKTSQAESRELRHLLKRLGWAPTASGSFEPPSAPVVFTDADAKRVGDFIEDLWRKGVISETDMHDYIVNLLFAVMLSRDYQRLLRADKTISYKIALWQRDPFFDGVMALDPKVYEDLSVQVLTIKAPNGDILGGGAVLRLIVDPQGELCILYSAFQTRANRNNWVTKAMEESHLKAIHQIGARLGIPEERIHLVQDVLELHWTSGFTPVDAPLGSEKIVDVLKKWRHPHEALFKSSFGTYDALGPIPDAAVRMTNPWVGLDGGLETFFLREIDPNPDPSKAGDYFCGFSANRGRAVNYHIDYIGPDGTHWHFLSNVGVGRTAFARSGTEKRDGLSGMDEVMARYYFTNMMHHVAGPLGFRTSLGIAVVDRNKIREGHTRASGFSQRQASIFELAREELRPNDLSQTVSLEETIGIVKQRIAQELGRESLTNTEYAEWLGHTIGEQLAIMYFFGFDHGVTSDTQTPQLHEGNVTLAGEIRDFETARLLPTQPSYPITKKILKSRYLRNNEISLEGLRKLQNRTGIYWLHWLVLLLRLTEGVDFYATAKHAFFAKLLWLKKSGINPAEEIRRFNVERWNPFIRNLGRQRHL